MGLKIETEPERAAIKPDYATVGIVYEIAGRAEREWLGCLAMRTERGHLVLLTGRAPGHGWSLADASREGILLLPVPDGTRLETNRTAWPHQ